MQWECCVPQHGVYPFDSCLMCKQLTFLTHGLNILLASETEVDHSKSIQRRK